MASLPDHLALFVQVWDRLSFPCCARRSAAVSLSHGNPPSSFPQAHQEFLLPFLSTRFLLLMMFSSQRPPGTCLLAVEQPGFVTHHSGREPWAERWHRPRNRVLRTALWVLSRVRLSATPWTATHQGPLSMGFPRQEHWGGLPFPLPGESSQSNDRRGGGFFTREVRGLPRVPTKFTWNCLHSLQINNVVRKRPLRHNYYEIRLYKCAREVKSDLES